MMKAIRLFGPLELAAVAAVVFVLLLLAGVLQ